MQPTLSKTLLNLCAGILFADAWVMLNVGLFDHSQAKRWIRCLKSQCPAKGIAACNLLRMLPELRCCYAWRRSPI